MKKTFALSHPKIKPARLVESIKHDIKKYIARERRKKLPSGTHFWAFDCEFGASAEATEEIHIGEINKNIDAAVAQELSEFYIVILARAAVRQPRPAREYSEDDDSDFDEDDADLDD